MIAASDAFAPATLVASALGVVALPIWWRVLRARAPAPLQAPRTSIDGAWPFPVAIAVFVLYSLLSATALAGIREEYLVASRLALTFAVVIGVALAGIALPRLSRPSVTAAAALGLGVLTFLAALPVVYGIAYIESLIFGVLPPQDLVESIARREDGIHEMVFLAVAVAPLFEEFVFRGLIQGGLRRTRSPRYALLCSAALFGIVHLASPTTVLPMVAFGLGLGLLMERTGSLLACFIAHSAFNSLSVAVLLFS